MAQNFINEIKEYEEKVKVIGYYCSTCRKDWVLKDWGGNTVPNDTKRTLQYHHQQRDGCNSHFTREDAHGFVKYVCQGCRREWRLEKVTEDPARGNDRTSGYTCSTCTKEWLVEGIHEIQEVEADMKNLRRHRHGRKSFSEVQAVDGTAVEVNRFVCAKCKKEWLLSFPEGQELIDTLRSHHGSQGCDSAPEFKGGIRVKQYSCIQGVTSYQCRQKWFLKEIPLGNNELLRRVREMKALWDHHRETGCLGEIQFIFSKDFGECDLETDARVIIGYYCTDCKTEWLSDEWNRNPAPSIEAKVIDHHYVPKFKHLRISDTGIRVYWHDVLDKLQPGDHLAWQRFPKYWHHAIVETKKDHEVTVIQWTSRSRGKICGRIPKPSRTLGIYRTCINRGGYCGRVKEFFDGPMYKVVYPKAVEMQNPSELVLFRARSRLYNQGYSIASDNCEHFATFCKTGSHTCRQISQLQLTCKAWGVKRLVIAVLYVIFLISFAEMFEQIFGKGKDYVGLMLIGTVELIHAVYSICRAYHKDTPRENFTKAKYSHRTTACWCASGKIMFKSFCMVIGTVLVTVFLINKDLIKKLPKESRHICEILISVAGGLCGSAIGFILADWCTFGSCCCSRCCRGQVHHGSHELLLRDVEENYQSVNI